MIEKEVKNIKALEKEEEEEATKVFLFRIIIGSLRNTLSFNTLNQEELTISLDFILKTPITFQDN